MGVLHEGASSGHHRSRGVVVGLSVTERGAASHVHTEPALGMGWPYVQGVRTASSHLGSTAEGR